MKRMKQGFTVVEGILAGLVLILLAVMTTLVFRDSH